MEISKEILIGMYWKMMRCRCFEEKIIELYRAGIKGLYHLSIGQEAVAVGVCSALKKDDYILSTHRGKAHYLAKGGDIKALMAEFMEKRTGCNKGKGGPMHIIDTSVGMLGANGIVGSSLPIACGAALTAQIEESGRVAVGFFGDGAANSGPCHESMNLAGIWKLPVVFICENNQYQVSVPISRHCSIQDLQIRAAGYGIPGVVVDGMDVESVYKEACKAIQNAREGLGATLIECKTYRFRGHAESDPTRGLTYRDIKEIEFWEEKCPIKKTGKSLLSKGWIKESELEEIERKCRLEVEEAIAFAESSPEVPVEWALKDIFA